MLVRVEKYMRMEDAFAQVSTTSILGVGNWRLVENSLRDESEEPDNA